MLTNSLLLFVFAFGRSSSSALPAAFAALRTAPAVPSQIFVERLHSASRRASRCILFSFLLFFSSHCLYLFHRPNFQFVTWLNSFARTFLRRQSPRPRAIRRARLFSRVAVYIPGFLVFLSARARQRPPLGAAHRLFSSVPFCCVSPSFFFFADQFKTLAIGFHSRQGYGVCEPSVLFSCLFPCCPRARIALIVCLTSFFPCFCPHFLSSLVFADRSVQDTRHRGRISVGKERVFASRVCSFPVSFRAARARASRSLCV